MSGNESLTATAANVGRRRHAVAEDPAPCAGRHELDRRLLRHDEPAHLRARHHRAGQRPARAARGRDRPRRAHRAERDDHADGRQHAADGHAVDSADRHRHREHERRRAGRRLWHQLRRVRGLLPGPVVRVLPRHVGAVHVRGRQRGGAGRHVQHPHHRREQRGRADDELVEPITIDNPRRRAPTCSPATAAPTAGLLQAGDWIRLTWSEPIAPASVLAGLDRLEPGDPRCGSRTPERTTRWTSTTARAPTRLNLVSTAADLKLGGNYVSRHDRVQRDDDAERQLHHGDADGARRSRARSTPSARRPR